MKRRPLVLSSAEMVEVAVTYQVSLAPDVIDAVRISFDHSNQSWPTWVEEAVARLKRENVDELVNLLDSPRPSSRQGKQTLSFRLYPSTLETIRQLATQYNSNVQTVLSHAFFMHSLAADF